MVGYLSESAEHGPLRDGLAGLCRVLVVTALLAALLTLGMVRPILATWWPHAAVASSGWVLIAVWLAVIAWTVHGTTRR